MSRHRSLRYATAWLLSERWQSGRRRIEATEEETGAGMEPCQKDSFDRRKN